MMANVSQVGKVDLLDLGHMAEWDRFVDNHSRGTVFHSSAWADCLQDAFAHMRARFYVIRASSSGEVVAGVPVYLVSSPILGKRFASVPFSTWCEPLVSCSEQFGVLLEHISEVQVLEGVRSWEIRSRMPLDDRCSAVGWCSDPKWLHHFIRLDRYASAEEYWSRLPRNALRRLIRKTEKTGVIVGLAEGGVAVCEFYNCLVDSRKTMGLPMIPHAYFDSLRCSLPKEEVCFLEARRDGCLLGSMLLYVAKGICHAEFVGERLDLKESGIKQFLTWKAISLAFERGCSEFSFGRTAIGQRGLIEYKRRWQTEEESLYVCVKDLPEGKASSKIQQPPLRRMVMLGLGMLPRKLYVKTGELVYRHWG